MPARRSPDPAGTPRARRRLAESGLVWTAQRHGFYGDSGIAMMGDASKTGSFETATDGRVAWTAHADLAEAAAIVLADEGRFDGPTPPFTGPEALDFGDLADIASSLQDAKVTRTVPSDADMRAKVLGRGAPERAADMVLGSCIGVRNGEWATLDPTLGELLGRPLVTMEELIGAGLAG